MPKIKVGNYHKNYLDHIRNLTPINRLAYWIQERESIRLKKEAGEKPPWTDDTILQTFRFCNIRRMDDKVSKWLLENWYEPNFDHPNMLVAVALARFLNRPEALEYLGFLGFPTVWNSRKIVDKLLKYGESGNRLFNGAYMVTGQKGEPKVVSVVTRYVESIRGVKLDTESMENSVNILVEKGVCIASFIAGQIVADMRWAVSGNWSDRNTWAAIGPGSLRGMNRIQGRVVNKSLAQPQFLEELIELRDVLSQKLPTEITDRLELSDFQNTLCETDKYNRVLLGEGKPKQLYRGGK